MSKSKSKGDLEGLAAREAASTISLNKKDQTNSARARDPRFLDMLERLRDGQSLRGACGLAKMPRATVYEWMEKSPNIKAMVDEAIDEGFGMIEMKFMQGSSNLDDTDWRALSWMLARRFPAEYGDKQALEVTHKKDDGVPEVIAMLQQTQHLVSQSVESVDEQDEFDD